MCNSLGRTHKETSQAGCRLIVTVTGEPAPDAPDRRRRLAALLFGPNKKSPDARELHAADSNKSEPETPRPQNEAPSSERLMRIDQKGCQE